MASKVAGEPAGKYTVRDPASGKFTRRGPAPAAPAGPAPTTEPAPELVAGHPADDQGRPSVVKRILSGSLGDLIRGR